MIFQMGILLWGKFGILDQDSHLALTGPLYACLHIHGMFTGDRVMGLLAQERGGEETPILASPLFLVCNWSGIHQSSETCPQNPFQWEEQGGGTALRELRKRCS